jgi:hypothetical protein
VGEELSDRNWQFRQLGDVFAHGVAQIESALVAQPQDADCHERLRDRTDPVLRGRRWLTSCGARGRPSGPPPDDGAVSNDPDHKRRQPALYLFLAQALFELADQIVTKQLRLRTAHTRLRTAHTRSHTIRR